MAARTMSGAEILIQTLIDQGVDHKSIIRFATPGLNGIKGAGF